MLYRVHLLSCRSDGAVGGIFGFFKGGPVRAAAALADCGLNLVLEAVEQHGNQFPEDLAESIGFGLDTKDLLETITIAKSL